MSYAFLISLSTFFISTCQGGMHLKNEVHAPFKMSKKWSITYKPENWSTLSINVFP